MTAVATGADLVSGGLEFPDSSSTCSLPLLPVDPEIAGMARRMVQGIDIRPEMPLGEAVERVCIRGDDLNEKETRRRAGRRARPAARRAGVRTAVRERRIP
jgi:trimethylamine:corrinoid methyltransferase-like protein